MPLPSPRFHDPVATTAFAVPPEGTRLPEVDRAEQPVVEALLQRLLSPVGGAPRVDWSAVVAQAGPWVAAVREHPAPFWALDSLLREYPISSAEGLALMRLAEALLRVPDAETAIALTADQLGRADFSGAKTGSPSSSPHRLLAGLSASAIALSKKFLPDGDGPTGLIQRLGAHTVVAATLRAIALLGRQFVLGRSIEEALSQSQRQRTAQASQGGGPLCFSFDMLGEGARTEHDARRYAQAYEQALSQIAAAAQAQATGDAQNDMRPSPQRRDGISIKLSALFSRYEVHQRERVFAELLPRVWRLVEQAAQADINLTIDAEEAERLELSLDVFEALAQRIANVYPQWTGFGLAVQAYQTRSLEVVHEVVRIARRWGLKFMVRLVKGAYWDAEIKRAQELGLAGYPVFTHKHHTDVAYLACAQALLAHHEVIYAQFATHNAGTIAALLQMAKMALPLKAVGAAFEFQRLHGMSEGLYREVLRDPTIACRIYAPVGEHRDLLAYLVRRLLENGAQSSFVHQLADESVALPVLLSSPLRLAPASNLPLPVALYGPSRPNSMGVDLCSLSQRTPLLDAALKAASDLQLQAVALPSTLPKTQIDSHTESQIEALMGRLHAGFEHWRAQPLAHRSGVLRLAADALESKRDEFCALLVKEAFKTWGDAVSEVREAVDFCRYYALAADERLADQVLPGPTGERNVLRLHGRGVFVCISPWNFPLAIFAGQVVAALVAGNAVAAKPAEQTPVIAQRFVELLHGVGVPSDVVACVPGLGETVGAALVRSPLTAGVCFTGSTAVAKTIARTLVAQDGPIVPLVAETGGLNAMVVDSTALPEQVVDAVVQSAFRSAGQRCSALRLLCLHEGIADGVIDMLVGALAELRVGDPSRMDTDVGPLIDAQAHAAISQHVQRLKAHARCLGEARSTGEVPHLLAPVMFELPRVADLKEEVFGPVLHVVRWSGEVERLVQDINALGYGLTLGVQTRIDSRAQRIADRARVGNVYVNRNMIGAVVGVQPFGGEGLSGTGPKAGGPHYLYRFCAEQTVTVNTAAAGGNAELLAQMA